MSNTKKQFIVKPHIETFQTVPRVQSIIWTVAPKGRGKNGNLQLSLIASPRLQVKQAQPLRPLAASTSPEVQLSYFPDFIDWPTWLEQTLFKNLSITFQSVPDDDKKTFTARYPSQANGARAVSRDRSAKAKQISLATDPSIDPSLWPRVFPSSTKVRSFELAVDKVLIDEIPIDNQKLEKHIEDIYSRCGIEFINPPPIDRMKNVDYFGSVMDEMQQPVGTQAAIAQMATDTVSSIAEQALFNPGNGQSHTMSYTMPGGSAQKPVLPNLYKINVGSAYQPIMKRLRSNKRKIFPSTPPGPYDFHEILSILLNYPALLRRLGLVIDLEIQDTAKTAGTFNVSINTQGLQGESWKYHAAPLTHCVAEKNGFYAVPGSDSGLAPGGMLAFGNENQYRLMQTDVVGGGFKNLQYTAMLNPLGSDGEGTAALPAERTVGLGMRMVDRVAWQKKRFESIQSLDSDCFSTSEDGLVNGHGSSYPPLLYADDLLRGIKPDTAVLDEATGKWKWHSLCRREVQYFIGNDTIDCESATGESPDAEGVVTTGLVKQPTEDKQGEEETSYHLLESLFRWSGWSLCVPPLSGQEWPSDGCGTGGGAPDSAGTQFGLNAKTRISVACGSLPLLRFGKKYKFRARSTDIAGNSLPWNSNDETQASPEILFSRYEPVPTPVMHHDKAFGPDSPGESMETLVIRSNYDTDGEDQPTDRDFFPPQTTFPLAEYHGMFDVNGKFDPNVARTMVQQYIEPLRLSKIFSSKHLTDPLAQGVVFSGLPGADAQAFVCDFSSTGNNWPENKKKLRIRIKEGSKAPERTGDEITVYLPKAEQVRVSYSSLIGKTELDSMAQWGRMLKYQEANSNDSQISNLMESAEAAATMGLHSMLTPHRKLLLVHAVRQPLEVPVLVPVFDTDNRKGDTMRRESDATWSYLDGVIQIHGKSTGSVDVYAYWTEFIDDPDSDEGVKKSPVKQHVLRSDVHLNGSSSTASSGGLVRYMEKPERGALFLGTHINDAVVVPMEKSAKDVKAKNAGAFEIANTYSLSKLWGSDRIKLISKEKNIGKATLAGILKTVPPKHEFADTKHRSLVYEVEGTTRFREYFGPMRGGATAKKIVANNKSQYTAQTTTIPEPEDSETVFRRTGPETKTIHIPSSARPAPVRVSYAIPTFGWEPLREEGNKRIRTRRGNGIRVFVESPWFSSGEDELLGVIVLPNGMAMDEKWHPYVSQWGRDPIWNTANLPSNAPGTVHFRNGLETAHGLSLVEKESETQGDKGISVVGYGTTYDKNRRLWYADIEMNPGNVYFPFVRLALARYQPYSVENAHLSAITQTDFIQLLPDRTATVTMVNQNTLNVEVTGVFCDECFSKVTTTLEVAREGVSDETLKWQPVDDPSLNDGFVGKQHKGNHVYSCSGFVNLPEKKANEKYRVVVKEYENYLTSEEKLSSYRLVYADAFELDY